MSFRLTSNDSSFNNRVNSLFDSLESASKVHEKVLQIPKASCDQANENTEFAELPSNSDNFCFKKPFKPKPYTSYKNVTRSARYLPGYVKNPNKWTCYSLEDTESKNDAQNQVIASELMLSLKQGNDLPYADKYKLSDELTTKKIEFCKKTTSSLLTQQHNKSASSDIRKSSEHFILPNYEIGKPKYKPLKSSNKDKMVCKEIVLKSKEITLTHLSEEGYEDE